MLLLAFVGLMLHLKNFSMSLKFIISVFSDCNNNPLYGNVWHLDWVFVCLFFTTVNINAVNTFINL